LPVSFPVQIIYRIGVVCIFLLSRAHAHLEVGPEVIYRHRCVLLQLLGTDLKLLQRALCSVCLIEPSVGIEASP